MVGIADQSVVARRHHDVSEVDQDCAESFRSLFDDLQKLIDLEPCIRPIWSAVIDFFQALGIRLLDGRIVGDLPLLEAALLEDIAHHSDQSERQQDRPEQARAEGKARVTLVGATKLGKPTAWMAQTAGGC
ncbi:MAG TPA: hypothetical protein VGX72_13350 [Solirubrobacteraceae bacterium]|nr:hypothetical protein [Solirubrobacteraceae bacterium]